MASNVDTYHGYYPSREIRFRSQDGTISSFVIEQAFTPFTQSAVVVVKPSAPPFYRAILKIYDPRVLKDRVPSPGVISLGILTAEDLAHDTRPWSLKIEKDALIAREQRRRSHQPELTMKACRSIMYPDEGDPTDPVGRAKQAIAFEESFYLKSMDYFECESTLYSLLKDLQGTAIPKIFSVGSICFPKHERAIQPPALLMEYVHGITLRDADLSCVRDPKALFTPLVHAIDSLAPRGLAHLDLNPGNIILSPPHAPQRVVLIDFGESLHEPEPEMFQTVREIYESEGIRLILHKRLPDRIGRNAWPAPPVKLSQHI
jgi:serine/threonine protein kinase